MRSWTGIGLVVCGLGLGSVAMAGGIRLTGGIGDDSTRFAELGYRSTLMAPRPLAGNWDWSVPWEASIGYWRADHDKPGARSLGIAGIAPLVRISRPLGDDSRFYAEAGIGGYLLSHAALNDSEHYGSSFQFGSSLGFGLAWGRDQRWQAGYRFRHVSNGGIASENSGMNLHGLQLGYNY